MHGTNLWPDQTNLAHASGVRSEQYLTLRHNALGCDYNGPFPNDELGCSADLTGYPDFAPIKMPLSTKTCFWPIQAMGSASMAVAPQASPTATIPPMPPTLYSQTIFSNVAPRVNVDIMAPSPIIFPAALAMSGLTTNMIMAPRYPQTNLCQKLPLPISRNSVAFPAASLGS